MADFRMGQGARYPTLTATLTADGSALDLSSAISVSFRGRLPNGTTVFTGACTILDALAGTVSYPWGTSDTAVSGLYTVEFYIVWVTGPPVKFQTIPSDRTATLEVVPANT